MKALPALLAGLLVSTPAFADLRSEMADLAAGLQALSLPADGPGAQAAVTAAVDQLHELKARADVYAGDRPRGAWIAALHLAEGEFGFGRGLLRAACPSALTAPQCTIYERELASSATIWLGRASGDLEVARARGGYGPRDLERINALSRAINASLAEAEAKPKNPPPPPTGPWVAVRGGAWLTAPDGQRVRLPVGVRESEAPIRMVLIERRGDRVEVGVAPAMPLGRSHCLDSGPISDVFNVRFEIDAADLAQVTVREVQVSHPDGTGVRLPPGVPLSAGGVFVRDLRLPVALKDSDIGTAWSSGGEPWTWQDTAAWVPSAGPLLLGGSPVTVVTSSDWFAVQSTATRGGTTLVTRQSWCGDLSLAHAGPLPERPSTDGLGSGVLGVLRSGRYAEAKAGAPLSWPDGTPAGALRGWRSFDAGDLRAHGDLTCARLAIGWREDGPDTENALTVCVPTSALTFGEAPSLGDSLEDLLRSK